MSCTHRLLATTVDLCDGGTCPTPTDSTLHTDTDNGLTQQLHLTQRQLRRRSLQRQRLIATYQQPQTYPTALHSNSKQPTTQRTFPLLHSTISTSATRLHACNNGCTESPTQRKYFTPPPLSLPIYYTLTQTLASSLTSPLTLPTLSHIPSYSCSTRVGKWTGKNWRIHSQYSSVHAEVRESSWAS